MKPILYLVNSYAPAGFCYPPAHLLMPRLFPHPATFLASAWLFPSWT